MLDTLSTLDTKVESFQAGEVGSIVWTLNETHLSSQPRQSLAFRTLKHVNLMLRYHTYISGDATSMAHNFAICLASAEGLKPLKLAAEALGKRYLEDVPETDFLRPLPEMCSEFVRGLDNQALWVSAQLCLCC